MCVVGAFSPIDGEFEQDRGDKEVALREIPGTDVIASHGVTDTAWPERENASILNAAILRYAKHTVNEFCESMKALNLTCTPSLTQDNGTLLDLADAANVPIRPFSFGATNSMRGAAYVSGSRGRQGKRCLLISVAQRATSASCCPPACLDKRQHM